MSLPSDKIKFIKPIPEFELLDYARRHGSGDLLKDALAPFTFFVLLRWVERQEREEQAVALFDERPYEPLLPPQLDWSNLAALDPTELFHVVHHELLPLLERLEGSPLAEILRAAAFAFDPKKLTEPLLYKALRLVDRQPFETAEDLHALDKLIRKIIQQAIENTRYAGEFITPPRVAQLMLEIAAPQPGETIYDPCFGMGYLLAGAARRIVKAATGHALSKWEHVQHRSIYGIELSPDPYLVGTTRLILSGISYPHLSQSDTLERNPYAPEAQFDVILAAPPIGGRVSERHRNERYPVRANTTENLFLQHIMASLRPQGRAVVALPEGFLFRGGADEQVRHRLLTEFCVEGVISLPAGTLLPYTGVKPNLLIFRRSAPQDHVWFQEAKPTGKGSSRAILFDAKREAQRFIARQESDTAWLAPFSEIVEHGYDLSVKQRRADELEAFIKELREHDRNLEVVPLEAVAEVISGISYTRRDTSTEPNLYSAPLIRVTELAKDGELKSSKLHLNDVILGRTAEERRLQPGDLVLSTQGTLGKVGLVREAHSGGVPAHGITTIRVRSQKVQPLYLVRLLQSGPYQQWLAAHASGTTIMNLPVRELRQLLIPLPTPEIQRVIATGTRAGADTTEFLKSIVSGRAQDDFLSFLLSDPTINDLITMRYDEAGDENRFSRLAAALRPWRNRAAHKSAIGDPALSRWLLKASQLAEHLADAFELPKGAERLAVFGVLEDELDELDMVKADLTDESLHERLYTLAEAIKGVLHSDRRRILEHTPVTVTLDSAFVDAEAEAEIAVRFRNDGSLPIRKLTIHTSPDASETKTSLLRASGELICSVPVPPRRPGTYPLSVKWKAIRLDNRMIGGEVTFDYSARAHTASARDDLGGNPYIVGTPLTSSKEQEMFFGREDIIEQIRRTLRSSGPSTVLLLEGNRRAGKTSILHRLLTPGVLPGWIPVYWSTQRAEGGKRTEQSSQDSKSVAGLEDKEIFYNIAHELVLAVKAAGYTFEIPGVGQVMPAMPRYQLREQLRTKLRGEFNTGSPVELLDILLESVSASVTDQRVLLLLDEFDKIQEGIESGVTTQQVPENLRALFHKHDHLSGILTGARRIKHLRENHWSALYGIGVPITVDALDAEAARRLLTEPVEGRLVYTFNARERVLELTSRQPYLIQSLCYRIFEECASTNERSVAVSTVEAAAREMVTDNEHFRTLFDFIGSERRRYLACIVNRLSEAGERTTFDLIAEELEKDRVEYDASTLADDLKHLQELDVLDLEQHELGTSYKIKIPLFSRWLAKNEHDRMHRQLAAAE